MNASTKNIVPKKDCMGLKDSTEIDFIKKLKKGNVFIFRDFNREEQLKKMDSAICVDASYKCLGTFYAEMKIFDPRKDNCTSHVPEQMIISWADQKKQSLRLVNVPEHYGRVEKYLTEKQGQKTESKIIKNFFILPAVFGQKIIVKITVKKKIDYYHQKEILCFDLVQDHGLEESHSSSAIYKVSWGVPSREITDNGDYQFPIPGSDKCVRFSKKNQSFRGSAFLPETNVKTIKASELGAKIGVPQEN
ncbi:MAG: hypothetical protein WC458_03040 [Patescibacteria group bacterium]